MSTATADQTDAESVTITRAEYEALLAQSGGDGPVLIALNDMVRMFSVTAQTVYRWRVPRGKNPEPALPKPDRVLAGKPFWHEDVVLEFGKARGHTADRAVLKQIRKAQGR